MTRTRKPALRPRKSPRQTRSTQLVADILEAAVRVLIRDGARRFTTARVAETAGVSVGSLYQYFPNKQAILFHLQTTEWQQTMGQLEQILRDSNVAPLQRLRTAVRTYFQSECDEAEFRSALEEAAPLYLEAPEAHSHALQGRRLMERFMQDALPQVPARERTVVADLMRVVMSSTGKALSSETRSRSEVDRLAAALGDMFCVYLESMHQRPASAQRGIETPPPRQASRRR